MRIAYVSDTHLEFYGEDIWLGVDELCDSAEFYGCDYLVIAGDLCNQSDVPAVLAYIGARMQTMKATVLYVPGNHEFYGGHIHDMHRLKNTPMPRNVHILSRSFYHNHVDDTLFVGAVGWIDGSWTARMYESKAARKQYNDFTQIKGFRKLGLEYGKADSKAIDKLLKSASRDTKKVVITHFLPTPDCINTKYIGDGLNMCYANDYTELIRKHEPDVWFCGHSHDPVKVDIGKTKIRSNPADYLPNRIANNKPIKIWIHEI